MELPIANKYSVTIKQMVMRIKKIKNDSLYGKKPTTVAIREYYIIIVIIKALFIWLKKNDQRG